MDVPVSPKVQHCSLVFLKWNTYRFELVGGLLLAIGPPGTRNVSPGEHDSVWDLEGVPDKVEFVPALLWKESEQQQWHDGKKVPSMVRMRVEGGGAHVWDVESVYERLAMNVIRDMELRTNETLFVRNKAHWGPKFDERGFIRQSEIRVSFPSIPMPGCCVEECSANRVSAATFQMYVDMVCSMCGVDVPGLEKQLVPSLVTESENEKHRVLLNVLEALSTAILGLSGVHCGYDTELIDDTCVPWQECGTNSDCEDFAFAAVALHRHVQTTKPDGPLSPLAKYMWGWLGTAYETAYAATGFVTPSAARPDLPPTEDGLAGHGFVLLKRIKYLQPSHHLRFVLVECTAVTLSYRPSKASVPGASMKTVCAVEFGDLIQLHKPCSNMQTSIGSASLLGFDSRGYPFKYEASPYAPFFISFRLFFSNLCVCVQVQDGSDPFDC
jgi:hypothetical protein